MNAGLDSARAVLRKHAVAMTEAIIARAGSEAVTAVFAGGSLATGHVAGYLADELEIYSDVDLYVVARDEDLERVQGCAVHARTLPPPHGVRLLRPMDIGVYTAADLAAQPARPGTVGLRARHLTLHGDPAIVDGILAAISPTIDPLEGLYLVENRVREFLATPVGAEGPVGRLNRYFRVKTVLDVVCAVCVVQGCYQDGGDPRGAIQSVADAGELPEGWDGELVSAALNASSDLPGLFGADEDRVITGDRTIALALSAWKSLAGRLLDSTDRDWATLLLRRCKAGDYVRNFREFLALGSGHGLPRPRMALTGASMARYSAVAALRLGALLDAVLARGLVDDIGMRSLDGLRAYLDRLTDVFGFSDGRLVDRVGTMHRAISGG